jgi:Mrp family chromosome partitioning ATPase
MSNEVDVVVRQKEGLLVNLIRTSSNLPLAKIRNVSTLHHAHKELVKLVQRLFLSGSNAQAVVFSAVESGSGCTFISTRVAEILANQVGEPVCLVDANFRSPRMNELVEVEEQKGSAKKEHDELTFMPVALDLARARTSNLWLAVYRPGQKDCPRLSSLDRFQNLIADLRRDFTYIVIDAPPLGGYPDAALFARMSDGLVMILEANDTRRDTARKAKEVLEASGISVVGAVLNKRTFPIPESLYRRL